MWAWICQERYRRPSKQPTNLCADNLSGFSQWNSFFQIEEALSPHWDSVERVISSVCKYHQIIEKRRVNKDPWRINRETKDQQLVNAPYLGKPNTRRITQGCISKNRKRLNLFYSPLSWLRGGFSPPPSTASFPPVTGEEVGTVDRPRGSGGQGS
jgi:hypothetical protein